MKNTATKTAKILAAIANSKEVSKKIAANKYYSNEQFISDGFRYLAAIKEGRMLCTIPSVSASGMSRVLKFVECSKGKTRYNYMNFYSLFLTFGYSEDRNKDGFRVNGCGMDMVFYTNYSIIHSLCNLGFISKKECEVLAQNTPVRI